MMYFQPRQVRRPVQFNAVQQPQVDAMAAVIDQMSPRTREFAGNLLWNFRTYGRLSEKQMHWVVTLTQGVTAPKPAQQPVEQISVQAIQDLFDRAGKNLRRVKVKLQTAAGQLVVFTRASAMSKYAGQIMITDGGPFGQNIYFGRIDVNGDFFPTGRATEEVQSLVREFAADPAAVAARYGKLTGGCSFCNHGLKDERSTQVGYGPVCAKNFGLAWG